MDNGQWIIDNACVCVCVTHIRRASGRASVDELKEGELWKYYTLTISGKIK